MVIVLDLTVRDLVYFSVGIIINMTLHEEVRTAMLQLPVVNKMIDLLKDANLEDMDLAKVACKAIHNLQGMGQQNLLWSEEAVKKLDEFTIEFGEELDEIMVSAALNFSDNNLTFNRMWRQRKSLSRSKGYETYLIN